MNPEAHLKPCYMLEHPKAQGATEATILEDETMGNQQATLEEKAWLAGIIDGEGYIGIQLDKIRKTSMTRRATVGISITNTDQEICLKAANIIKKLGLNPYLKLHNAGLRKKNTKVAYMVVVHRMAVASKLLKAVFPYLTGNKRIRAALVIEFCDSRKKNFIRGSHTRSFYSDRELEIIDACLPLQKRGASEAIRRAELKQSRFLRLKDESRRDKKTGRFCSYQNSEDMVRPFAKA